MKKERYIVEIEMPDGDASSSMYIQDIIQTDCDIENEGRWKVFVKEQQQLINSAMKVICDGCAQKAECEFNNWKTCSTKDELIKSMEEQL